MQNKPDKRPSPVCMPHPYPRVEEPPLGPASLASWVSSSLERILPQAQSIGVERPGYQPRFTRSPLVWECSELQSSLAAISEVPFLSIGSLLLLPPQCSHLKGGVVPPPSESRRMTVGGRDCAWQVSLSAFPLSTMRSLLALSPGGRSGFPHSCFKILC